MVALKAADADAFAAKPDSKLPVVLIYGPDAGLVRERADKIVKSSVDDPNDPFSLVKIEGDELSGNPFRLVEEANTIPLFGGKRAIWVKPTSRNLVPAVEALLGATSPDCRIVIEAGDLKRTSALRVICEKAKNAAALPCYADSERDLSRIIDEELRVAGLTISSEARATLVPFLGGDRQATRSELQKLALYAQSSKQVEVDDVLAVVADASASAIDGVVDAAFVGKLGQLEALLTKARSAGIASGTILFSAQRQAAQLHRMMLAVEEGSSVERALDGMRPPVHFRRRPAIEAALRSWNGTRLLQAMAQLSDAVLQSRKQADLAETLTSRALMGVASLAKRRG